MRAGVYMYYSIMQVVFFQSTTLHSYCSNITEFTDLKVQLFKEEGVSYIMYMKE